MLDQLLEQWELDYDEFADILGIHRQSLWQYRKGLREFRLNWQQILKLEEMLKKIKKQISDLPLDWYLDKNIDQDIDTDN